MANDSIERFFAGLQTNERMPALEPFTGTILLEVQDGRHTTCYVLSIARGALKVERGRPDAAHCTVRAQAETLDDIMNGRMNALQALLRGVVEVEGSGILLAALRRLLPESAPSGSEPAGHARRVS